MPHPEGGGYFGAGFEASLERNRYIDTFLDRFEYPVAAITVMAPSFRLKRFEEAGQRCVAAAAAVRERLLA